MTRDTSTAVAAEWLRRAGAEYASAAHAQQLTLWLIQIGAPPDLVADGLGVVADELAHAQLCLEAHRAAGGTEVPHLDRNSLALAETDQREHDVLREALRLFCLGETLAVAMFVDARRKCEAPAARAALDRIVHDEPRHRTFGWDILDWYLASGVVDDARSVVGDWLPHMIATFTGWYPADRCNADIEDEARRWGLTATADAAALVERAFSHDWRRRFELRGISYPMTPAGAPAPAPRHA